jgi:hypothetical protein
MKSILSLILLLFSLESFSQIQTVAIDSQVWMTKNLNVDKFRNGDLIPEAKTKEEWEKAGANEQPAWCYYNNDPSNGVKYGKLYNWYAVNDPRGLAPKGYHIPSDDEWTKLEDYLGNDEGAKMKSKSGWNSFTIVESKTCPNCVNWSAEYRRKVPCHTCKDTRSIEKSKVGTYGIGTNSSGFSGLPGGGRDNDGTFGDIGNFGFWWSSTEDDNYYAWQRRLGYYYGNNSIRKYQLKGLGLSVRCIKD